MTTAQPGGFGLRQPAAAFVLAACCGILGLGMMMDSRIVARSASRLAEESGSRLPQSMVLRTDRNSLGLTGEEHRVWI